MELYEVFSLSGSDLIQDARMHGIRRHDALIEPANIEAKPVPHDWCAHRNEKYILTYSLNTRLNSLLASNGHQYLLTINAQTVPDSVAAVNGTNSATY